MNFVVEDRNMSLIEAYNINRASADSKVCCDYAFHSAVYFYNDKIAKEMEILAKEKGNKLI